MAQHPAVDRALLRLSLQYQCGRCQDVRAGARNGGESDRCEVTVDLSGAYTQAYISAPKDTPGLPIAPGTRVTSIPKYTGNLAVSYETMLPQDYKMTFRVAESYVGPVYDTAYYAETLGSYGLMDFRMGVGKERWKASFFGTNLTNKHAGLTIDNTVFAWQQPTITRVSTNQPRTIGIGFETKF
jgi:iron complex outermembrane receptor protein